MELRLTPEEEAMLAGEHGPGVRRAMEIVVALARIYGAQDLVPIASAQVSGVSYRNLGNAGLEFLEEWKSQGARAQVPAWMNPAGMDLDRWREQGIPEDFAQKQMRIIRALQGMGVKSWCTCTPYLGGGEPGAGEHLAWAESSAVSYANSVLGARTNREGSPSALAASIVGRTGRYGLHLEGERRATTVVEVRCSVQSLADFGALGYLVGKEVKNRVPYLRGLEVALDEGGRDYPKALGAAMAASGAVALYHVEGVTPEAFSPEIVANGAKTVVISDLAPAYGALNSAEEAIDLVSLGCPHASLREIGEVAHSLEGRVVRTRLWITTSRLVRERTLQRGWVAVIEAAGGEVYSDTCPVVAPLEALGIRTLATNSAKAALYLPSHAGIRVHFGSLQQCIACALEGRWA